MLFIALACVGACATSTAGATLAAAQAQENVSLGKIKKATSAAINCSDCPRSLANAPKAAKQALATWGRNRLVDDPKQADILFILSGNSYVGDYLTRKGPNERRVKIDSTFVTVIDPRTGEELWSDSRNWGSWRVSGATRALIDELRGDLEAETKKWALDDIFRCSTSQADQLLAFLTRDAALAKPGSGVRTIDDVPNRLTVNSPDAPDFCRWAQLVIGTDNRITQFEVLALPSDALEVADVLEQADHFDFTSGKDPRTQKVYFTARSKNGKVLIQFDIEGRQAILSRVSYFY
ncbi:MAG: hypothetical protein WCC21_12095 [Candidatus Acidiferrales bacterium]